MKHMCFAVKLLLIKSESCTKYATSYASGMQQLSTSSMYMLIRLVNRSSSKNIIRVTLVNFNRFQDFLSI